MRRESLPVTHKEVYLREKIEQKNFLTDAEKMLLITSEIYFARIQQYHLKRGLRDTRDLLTFFNQLPGSRDILDSLKIQESSLHARVGYQEYAIKHLRETQRKIPGWKKLRVSTYRSLRKKLNS